MARIDLEHSDPISSKQEMPVCHAQKGRSEALWQYQTCTLNGAREGDANFSIINLTQFSASRSHGYLRRMLSRSGVLNQSGSVMNI